jgi:hypothetical protein
MQIASCPPTAVAPTLIPTKNNHALLYRQLIRSAQDIIGSLRKYAKQFGLQLTYNGSIDYIWIIRCAEQPLPENKEPRGLMLDVGMNAMDVKTINILKPKEKQL